MAAHINWKKPSVTKTLYKTYYTFHLQSSAPPNQESARELKPQPWARAMGQRHKQGLPRGEPGTHLSHVETYRCAPKHCPFPLPTRDGASLHRQRATAEVLLTQRPSKCYAFNFKADQKTSRSLGRGDDWASVPARARAGKTGPCEEFRAACQLSRRLGGSRVEFRFTPLEFSRNFLRNNKR